MLQFKYFNTLVLLVILAVIISILIYISNKGFDFTDEGLYMLFASPNQDNLFRVINYDILYKYLYQLTGFSSNIQESRLSRVILNILGSFSLYFGLCAYSVRTGFKKNCGIDFFLFIIISGFWNYVPDILPSTSYNTLNFFAIQIFLGGLFLIIFSGNKSLLFALFYSILVVAGLFITWITKPTSFPGLILILSLMLYNYRSLITRRIFFVMLLSLTLPTLAFFNFSDYASRVTPNMYWQVLTKVDVNSSHDPFKLFSRILGEGLLFITFLSFGVGLAYLKKLRKFFIIKLWIIFFIGLVALDFSTSYFKHKEIEHFFRAYFVFRFWVFLPLFLAFLLGYFAKHRGRKMDFKASLPYLIFLLAIFSYVFGSNLSNLYLSTACLQFLLIMLWMILPNTNPRVYFSLSSLAFLFIFYVVGLTEKLYRQESIWEQKFSYLYGPDLSNQVFLDFNSYHDQVSIDKIISKYPSPYIVGYTRMNGHIFLAGKVTPGSVLWGEEDIQLYFKKRFTHPENFILLLENKSSEQFIFNFIRNYSIKPIGKVGLKSTFRNGSVLQIYYCKKKLI